MNLHGLDWVWAVGSMSLSMQSFLDEKEIQ